MLPGSPVPPDPGEPVKPPGSAGADTSPTLPTTFRPRWARRVIYPAAALVVATVGIGVFFLPPIYHLVDRVGIVAVGLLIAAFLHRLADVRVVADQHGLTVVNLARRRRLEWAQVLGVHLPPGDPWLVLDLSDGDTLPALGVQGSDGRYAQEQARRLGQLVARQSRTERDN